MTDLWLELAVMILAGASGVGMGILFARSSRWSWLPGYGLSLGLVALVVLPLQFDDLIFVQPFGACAVAPFNAVLQAFAFPCLLSLLICKLSNPRPLLRWLVGTVACLAFLYTSIMPACLLMSARRELDAVTTVTTANGVCMQTKEYTCGPAAAVTVLAKLGIAAEEGQLAILFRTAPAMGTSPPTMAWALQKAFRSRGLSAELRRFHSIEELKSAGLTLAIMKLWPRVDHVVAVLEVTDLEVVIGDPMEGLERLPRARFLDKWRYLGVVVRRAT